MVGKCQVIRSDPTSLAYPGGILNSSPFLSPTHSLSSPLLNLPQQQMHMCLPSKHYAPCLCPPHAHTPLLCSPDHWDALTTCHALLVHHQWLSWLQKPRSYIPLSSSSWVSNKHLRLGIVQNRTLSFQTASSHSLDHLNHDSPFKTFLSRHTHKSIENNIRHTFSHPYPFLLSSQ